MAITRITIDADYFMSDEWEESYEEKTRALECMADWDHHSGGVTVITIQGVKVSEQLSALKIPYRSEDVTNDYVEYITTAPTDYDGHGTFTVGEIGDLDIFGVKTLKDCRIVAILKKHLSWQTGRYSSGLYYSEDHSVLKARK